METLMHGDLKVSSYVTIRDSCPMRYRVNGSDDVEFSLGGLREPFEFVFRFAALRAFLTLGAEALCEMEALRGHEAAEGHGQDAAAADELADAGEVPE